MVMVKCWWRRFVYDRLCYEGSFSCRAKLKRRVCYEIQNTDCCCSRFRFVRNTIFNVISSHKHASARGHDVVAAGHAFDRSRVVQACSGARTTAIERGTTAAAPSGPTLSVDRDSQSACCRARSYSAASVSRSSSAAKHSNRARARHGLQLPQP